HRAPVVEVLQDLQALLKNGMAFLALDVGDKAHAACVVLVGSRIQAVFLQMRNLGSRRHGALLNFLGESPEYRTAPGSPRTIIGVRFQFLAAISDGVL